MFVHSPSQYIIQLSTVRAFLISICDLGGNLATIALSVSARLFIDVYVLIPEWKTCREYKQNYKNCEIKMNYLLS